MATKVELLEYPGGIYGVCRTTNSLFCNKKEYLDLEKGMWRVKKDGARLRNCFTQDLYKVKRMQALTANAEGTAVSGNRIISLDEFEKMNKMAETDEGMRDVLNQAKEYFILKKK